MRKQNIFLYLVLEIDLELPFIFLKQNKYCKKEIIKKKGNCGFLWVFPLFLIIYGSDIF